MCNKRPDAKNRIVGLQLNVKDNVIVKTSHYGLASVEDSIAVDSQTVLALILLLKHLQELLYAISRKW
jgi:hypothetical protein